MSTGCKVFFVILCCYISSCSEPIPLPKLSNDAVILAFGDSLTYGTGATKEHDYPSILSSLTSLKVINEGVPGEYSTNGLKRLSRILDDYQPDLLILTHGGNDMLAGKPRQKTANNIRKMIELARQKKVAVLMLGVPLPRLFLLSSADFYEAIAEQYQVPAELEVLPKILSDVSLKSDLVHPNNKGYQLMAEGIFNLLKKTGAVSESLNQGEQVN